MPLLGAQLPSSSYLRTTCASTGTCGTIWFAGGPLILALAGNHLAATLFNCRQCVGDEDTTCVVGDVSAFYGSQALMLGRRTLDYVVKHWRDEDGFPDMRVARLASRVTPPLAHRPSLVQHVGFESTLGHSYIRASDFSRDWRPTGVPGDHPHPRFRSRP